MDEQRHGGAWVSPYINRFLSADTVVPNAANSQDLNRYSYVRNNPVRYIDPTGHVCSDPDDPTPSCDGSGGRPINTPAPLPPAPVIIRNPDPLDGGLQQDDPTPTQPSPTLPNPGGGRELIPDAGLPQSDDPVIITNPDPLDEGLIMDPGCYCGVSSQSQPEGSPMVAFAGLLLLIQLSTLDLVLTGGIVLVAVTAVTVPGAQIGLAAELLLIPLDFLSINLTIYAAQVAATGRSNFDPLPLLHAKYPDILPYKP